VCPGALGGRRVRRCVDFLDACGLR
jgi:hypothetical protein